MAKLYIFAIGGTGSRVLRSLTMLLASGTKLAGDFDTIVPIIIDPDSANGDLNRTTDILLKYQQIKEAVGNTDNFFKTEIKTLRSLSDGNAKNLADNFIFEIAGTANQTFDEFINYQGLDAVNREMLDLLYTKEELNSSMDVGFKGKPNIGSIVLNQIIKNAGYHQFANKFDNGDAIFIVSSIFGGTGAAGFPLLLKNLRTESPTIPHSNLISNSVIGAISFLPYFKITPPGEGEEQTIDSSTFFGKAQAALEYYEHAIFGNEALNAFYYLSDNSQNDYEHHDGKADQKNNAHFLELAGALAIIDFLKDIPSHETTGKRAVGATNKEFGVKDKTRNIDFNHLGPAVTNDIKLHLSKLALKEQFLRKSLEENLNSNTSWIKETGFKEKDFFNSSFYRNGMSPFLSYFDEWLKEMEKNDVGFAPFHDNSKHDNLLNYINGYAIKDSWKDIKKRSKAERLIENLNKEVTKLDIADSAEKSFVKIFDGATEAVVKKIFNMN